MSEITKLYENAGIEQTQDITCGDCEFVNYPEENKPCNACTQYGIKHYPPFTAEKQLKLIKWLLYNPKVDYLNMFYKNEEDYLEISIDCNNGYSYENSFDDNLEIAIASALNTFWQSLTEEEKQQIKGILDA